MTEDRESTMYARVTTLHANPDADAGRAQAIYREVIRELEGVDGFLGASFMLNAETHRAVSLTWWRDAHSAATGGERSLPLLIARIGDLADAPLEVAGFTVVDQTTVPSVDG
jgi:hypothetical protein